MSKSNKDKEVKPIYTKEEFESKKENSNESKEVKHLEKEEKKEEKKEKFEDSNKFKNEHPLEKKGEIEFSTGKHQVLIKTPNLKKKEVWISIDESSIDPTCSYLEGDLFSVKEVEDGFIIIASVESNGRKVYWFVK